MNQTQRDLTYRLDAVQSICQRHSSGSEVCQQSIQLWELQHETNVFSAQISSYIKSAWSIVGLCILGIVLFSWFLKMFSVPD